MAFGGRLNAPPSCACAPSLKGPRAGEMIHVCSICYGITSHQPNHSIPLTHQRYIQGPSLTCDLETGVLDLSALGTKAPAPTSDSNNAMTLMAYLSVGMKWEGPSISTYVITIYDTFWIYRKDRIKQAFKAPLTVYQST